MGSKQPHVLVLVSEEGTRKTIASALGAFSVQWVAGGEECFAAFGKIHPDLFIIDIDEGKDQEYIRIYEQTRRYPAVPVIVLVEKQGVEHEITRLIEIGIEDYLSKPFEPTDLSLRIKLVLHKSQKQTKNAPTDVIKLGNLEINLKSHKLTRDGKPLQLSRTDWALLELLIARAGKILSHQMILKHVWGDNYKVDDVYLRIYINRLRAKLEDDPANPQYIRTEPRIGYYLAGMSNTEIPPEPVKLLEQEEKPALSNLPPQYTSFFGRESEIATSLNILKHSPARLVTITGPGGSGKTRLGLQVAYKMIGDFRDGVYFVDLAPVSDPAMIPSRIAGVLGIEEAPGSPLFEQLKIKLRDKNLLLILDNFEQVQNGAGIVEGLLTAAHNLKMLVTSRSALQLYGEHELGIASLPVPDAENLPALEKLALLPSVALFCERVRAIKRDFMLDSQNAQAIACLCIQLDGLPLALELAATRIKLFTPQDMVNHLGNRLGFLSGGVNNLPARHQTIRNTIAWSFELLNSGEKKLFMRLGVFVGGFNLEAVEPIAMADGKKSKKVAIAQPGLQTTQGETPQPELVQPSEETLEIILSLINKSLLIQRVDENGQSRYTMLETIREFAREKLKSEGEIVLRQCLHAEYFLSVAEKANTVKGGAQLKFWTGYLKNDLDNIREAINWALVQNEVALALDFGAALWDFWHIQGFQTEGRRWVAAILNRKNKPRSVSLARVFCGAGWLARDQSDYVEAKKYFEQGLALARELGEKRTMAETLNGLGEMAQVADQEDLAISLFAESLEVSRELNDILGIAWSIEQLASLIEIQGDYERAKPLLDEGLKLFRELDHKMGTAYVLGTIAMRALNSGSLDEADTVFEESLSLMNELNDSLGKATYLNHLGEVALRKGNLGKATTLIEQSLAMAREAKYRWTITLALNNLGCIALARGNYGKAGKLFQESLTLSLELKAKRNIATTLHEIANLALSQNKWEVALQLYTATGTYRRLKGVFHLPLQKAKYQSAIETLNNHLSPAEFQLALARGEEMTTEEAMALAFSQAAEAKPFFD